MLKRHSQLVLSLLFLADMAVTGMAWLLAYYLRVVVQIVPVDPQKGVPDFKHYAAAIPVVLVVCALCYAHRRLYVPRREGTGLEEVTDIALANAYAAVVLVAIAFFYREFSFSRLVAGLFFAGNFLGLVAERALVRMALRSARRRGLNLRHVLVAGAGKLGQSLAERIEKNTWTGFKVVGFVDDAADRQGKEIHGVPVLGKLDDIPSLCAQKEIDHLFVALPLEEHARLADVMELSAEATVDVRIVPDLLSFATLNAHIGDFDGLPIITLRESPLHGWNRVLKRVFDLVFGAIFVVLWAIPMLLIAALIKGLTPGPVFYRQERMGMDGRVFKMLKFRSMRVDAEAETGAKWATADDPRRTPLGAFLRKFSLDELPQLFNVLKGDMSLVGPRPERPEFIEQFKKTIPKYMLRHKTKAGMTGWAQVNGWRGQTSLEKRVQYDLYYIEHWSLWFDLWILFLTLFKGLKSEHAY